MMRTVRVWCGEAPERAKILTRAPHVSTPERRIRPPVAPSRSLVCYEKIGYRRTARQRIGLATL